MYVPATENVAVVFADPPEVEIVPDAGENVTDAGPVALQAYVNGTTPVLDPVTAAETAVTVELTEADGTGAGPGLMSNSAE